jgi:hypothetical protein
MDDITAETVAMNDAAFRDANEQIRAAADAHEVFEAIPFICECADRECSAIVRLPASEYDTIRSVPTHFLNVRGHAVAGGSAVRVVEERPGYDLVENVGRAAEVATERDPRRDTVA